MMTDYWKDRIVLYDTENDTETYEVSGGVPQDSVLDLGFADKIAAVVIEKRKEEVTELTNDSIHVIHECLTNTGL